MNTRHDGQARHPPGRFTPARGRRLHEPVPTDGRGRALAGHRRCPPALTTTSAAAGKWWSTASANRAGPSPTPRVSSDHRFRPQRASSAQRCPLRSVESLPQELRPSRDTKAFSLYAMLDRPHRWIRALPAATTLKTPADLSDGRMNEEAGWPERCPGGVDANRGGRRARALALLRVTPTAG